MSAALKKLLNTLLFCMTAHSCMAQTYPDSSASWCFSDFNNSDFVRVQLIMGADPDTVVLGQTYKRILEYATYGWFENPNLVQRFYVRSDTSGKGYVMLLDSMQEYLAVDISANVGDTVHDVLTMISWEVNSFYWLQSVIVDSISTLENNGVSVTRRFIHAQSAPAVNPENAFQIFWQNGIGGSYGPIIMLNVSGGFDELNCLRVQDNYVYSGQFGHPGLPGIPCDCSLLPVGIKELHSAKTAFITPNPSTGQFTLGLLPLANTIAVYTSTGQQVWQGGGNTIDLTAQPPGVYTAVVATERGRQAVRLVVVR